MKELPQRRVRLLYLVHDLTDPAVRRRIQMLKAGGAEVRLAGFRRTPEPVHAVEGIAAFDLGRTENLKLISRVCSIVKAAVRLPSVVKHAGKPDVILARNLETLVLAGLLAGSRRRLAYEVLDIHRLLLGRTAPSAVLRSVERLAARSVDLIIVSSPAFLQAYFIPRWPKLPPVRLVENKPLEAARAGRQRGQAAGSPWRIGWFGMLRCQRSLDVLCALTRTPGLQMEVILRGRPTLELFSDFHGQIAATPGVSYLGAYDPDDLAAHYADIHLAWTIDFYEEGQNSAWLLPNRLYESLYWGAVPIALQSVQTGRWLEEHRVGLRVADVEEDLSVRLRGLTAEVYCEHLQRVAAVAEDALTCSAGECRELVDALAGPQA